MATSLFRVVVEDATVCAGDEFVARVVIDATDAAINAAQGALIYDPTQLTPVAVQYGGSFLRYWVTSPAMPGTPGEIPFVGGLPYPGFTGTDGNVMTVIFRAGDTSVGTVLSMAPDGQALLNDGSATPTAVSYEDMTVSILERDAAVCTTGPAKEVVIEDQESPAPFDIIITRDPKIFRNKYFAAFDTTDEGTGVSHYEVRESSQFIDTPWLVTGSPYKLQTQGGEVLVYVRAIDGAGNDTLSSASAMLEPPVAAMTAVDGLLLGTAIIAAFVILRLCFGRRVRE